MNGFVKQSCREEKEQRRRFPVLFRAAERRSAGLRGRNLFLRRSPGLPDLFPLLSPACSETFFRSRGFACSRSSLHCICRGKQRPLHLSEGSHLLTVGQLQAFSSAGEGGFSGAGWLQTGLMTAAGPAKPSRTA